MAVKIMVDSASDINLEEARNMGIELISMTINFGEEEFLDGVNLLPNKFYEKLTTSKVLPKTSMINSYRFEEAFKNAIKNGDELVTIVISSKLSGTYQAALQASESLKDKVYIVDSMSACVGERLLVEYALKLVKEGKSAKEIAEELDNVKSKVQINNL